MPLFLFFDDSLFADERDELGDAAGVRPLVVVPGQHLDRLSPRAMVDKPSTIAERESPRKSDDTNGSSE